MNNMYATIFISLMLVLVYLTINSYFFQQDQDFLNWEFKHYCYMVNQGAWPDYKDLASECIRWALGSSMLRCTQTAHYFVASVLRQTNVNRFGIANQGQRPDSGCLLQISEKRLLDSIAIIMTVLLSQLGAKVLTQKQSNILVTQWS